VLFETGRPIATISQTAAHQRSLGELRFSFKARGAETVLDTLRQDGCLKARFPRREDGGWTAVVTLNSSGGVAGGDTLATTISAGPGTRATVASQAAERFYRALPGSVSAVTNSVQVAEGAALEWLPQESILFDGCALRRRLQVELAPDAAFLGVENLVFGRTAMGEAVRHADIADVVEISRGGRRLLHDRIRLQGPVAEALARKAIGAGSSAVATLIYIARDAEARLDGVRNALAPYDAGASSWDGMLFARIVAGNGARLREAVVAGLNVLREGRPLPRVWLC
jgi:urease accessory protein